MNGVARFVEENYGESELARRFGVTRYPAIFVNDVLVATPNDFGFYGKGMMEKGGRYAPLQTAESHARLRDDLSRMIRLILAGRGEEARALARPAAEAKLESLPAFALSDLDGKAISREGLRGRVVMVEFWATWCPPCRSTLQWLGSIKRKYGDRLEIVAPAVQSDSAKVRATTDKIAAPIRWALSTPEAARSFGDVTAVPTLYIFDRDGKRAGSYFGAPPTLHADVERKLKALID
jgi:thiol-disulfide isomerase/thioredoxin